MEEKGEEDVPLLVDESVLTPRGGKPKQKQEKPLKIFLKASGRALAWICKIFCIYMFIVVFVSTISFCVNFVLQLIFAIVAFRRGKSEGEFTLLIFALGVFGLYAIFIWPILIYVVYKFMADSWRPQRQYTGLHKRLISTIPSKRVRDKLSKKEPEEYGPGEEDNWHHRLHLVVRCSIIIPSLILAIALGVVYTTGGFSVFLSWFVAIGFWFSLLLATFWVLFDYITALWKYNDYYLWLRLHWHRAGDKLAQENRTAARWLWMAFKRLCIIIGAFITPLSLHYVVYRYQIKKRKPLTEEELKLLRLGGQVNEPQKKKKKLHKCHSCLRGTARVLWTLVWLFIPLSLFSILVLGTMVSAAAGYHTFLFFYFTFPALALAAHKLWSPKRGVIWPFVTFIILLLLLVVGFSVLLSAVRGSQNSATTSPTLPLPRNLGKGAMANPSFYLGVDQDDHNRVSFASNSTSHNTSYHRDYMGYQICYSDWKGLDAIDFGLFSYLAYYDYGTSDFDTLFNRWFNTSDWNITAVAPKDNLVSFIEITSKSLNLSVVSVRGTANVADALEDLALWSEAIQLQGLSIVFPIAFTWPDQSTAILVQVMSYLSRVLFPPGSDYDYFTEVDQFVAVAKNNRTLLLTGHSLGGSIAKVVGARQQIPAITYCAPGTVYTRRKFDITLDNVEQYTVTIRPTADIISHIDEMGGVIQDIICDSDTYFPDCHFLDHVMCPMLRVGCGHKKRPTPPLQC